MEHVKNQKPLKIFVAVPMNRPVEFRTFESFVRLANLRGVHEYMFAFTQNSLVYDARETLVDQFLKSPPIFSTPNLVGPNLFHYQCPPCCPV